MADSMNSRSSPCPTRRANHSDTSASAATNRPSSAWVSRRFLRRRSRTTRSRSYTAPAASPSTAAVRYPASWADTTTPMSAEQTGEEPAALDRRVLVGHGVDAAVHVQLAAV